MQILNPDIDFKKKLTKISGADLNQCIQCGTCSVVCSLSPEDKPFPRKEMIWAGWGFSDKLIANTDVWLCHQCGDCSTHCPRDIKPANVLSAVRQFTYEKYAVPQIISKILNRPKLLPVAIIIPVVIISAILITAGTFKIPSGDVDYSKFFPHAWLNSSFTAITIIFYLLAFFGLKKFWYDMKNQFSDYSIKKSFIKSLFELKYDILSHKRFSECKTQKKRKISHILVSYGFVMLLVVTAYAIVAALTHNYPLTLWNPFKILGNIAALMLIIGIGMMIISRLLNKKTIGKSNYSDWLFLVSFFLLTISGVVVETARFNNWNLAYHLYFFHLVCVWFVIMYLPYTKFGHMLYRVIAMVFANSIERV